MKELYRGVFSHWLMIVMIFGIDFGAFASLEDESANSIFHEVKGNLSFSEFGTSVGLYNGRFSTTIPIVTLPGNSDIEVGVYLQENTEGRINTPQPFALPWISGALPCDFSEPVWLDYYEDLTDGDFTIGGGARPTSITGVGMYVHIPGRTPERIGRNAGESSSYTLNNYYYTCEDDFTVGEYPDQANDFSMTITIHTPDGVKYVFDQFEPKGVEFGIEPIFASYAKDAYGNQVDYIHTNGMLEKISASDGREITFEYNDNVDINSDNAEITITANDRQWLWKGAWTHPKDIWDHEPIGKRTLTLPDNTTWTFDATKTADIRPHDQCSDGSGNVIIKNPQNTKLTLEMKNKVIFAAFHARIAGGILPPQDQYNCQPLLNAAHGNALRRSSRHAFVTKATISGTSLPSNYVWSMSYQEGWGETVDNTEPYSFPLSRTLTRPDGSIIEYSFESHSSNPLISTLLNAAVKDTDGNIVANYKPIYGLSRKVLNLHGEDIGSFGGKLKNHQLLLKKASTQIGDDVFVTDFEYREIGDWDKRNLATKETQKSIHGSTDRITEFDYKNLSLDDDGSVFRIGLLEKLTENSKVVKTNTYNSKGKLQSSKEFDSSALTTYTYNDSGMVENVTMPLGRVDTFTNYKRGKAQTVTRAKVINDEGEIVNTSDTITESYVVDDNGWVTSYTDPNGYRNLYQYDDLGRNTEVSYDGRSRASEIITYTDLDNGLKVTQTISDKIIESIHDGLMRVISHSISDSSGTTDAIYRETAYDAFGRVVFESWPSFTIEPTEGQEYAYDVLGRVKSITENVGANATTSFEYLSGDKKNITDPSGNITAIIYSGYAPLNENEPIEIQSPEGVTTVIDRNQWGLQKKITQKGDWDGSELSFSQNYYYDSRLRLCSKYTPETGYARFAYDDENRITEYQEGANSGSSCQAPTGSNSVGISYDPFHRVRNKNFADSGTMDISRKYDKNGNNIQIKRGSIVWDYIYDDLNQLKDEKLDIDGLHFDTHYDYDLYGGLEAIKYPSGDLVNLSPDIHGSPTKISALNDQYAENYATSITYHANKSLDSFTFGNDLKFEQLLSNRQLPTSRDVYDDSGSTITSIMEYDYVYDTSGNIESIIDSVNASRTIDNTYDGLNRLKTSNSLYGNITYTYDPIGNIRKRSVIGGNSHGGSQHNVIIDYSSKNRVDTVTTSSGVRSFSHDERGNVTNNGIDTFEYDMSNQPKTISGTSDAFLYDGNLKRVKKNTNNQTVYFVYTKIAGLVSQYNKTTNVHTDYIRLQDQVIARIESGGSLADSQTTPFFGSLPDVPSFTNNESNYYLPFGKSVSGKPTQDSSIGFTGHINDDSGLTYMQARYYDPVIGRFYSNDPVDAFGHMQRGNSIAHGFNRYAYANNNPYKYTDPDGEFVNFAVKFVADVALGAALNYAETGSLNLGAAVTDAAVGVVNPAKTVQKAKRLAKVLSGGCSFTPETMILTKEGYKSIIEIDVGDIVLAKNDQTGEVSWRKVTNTFKDWHLETITLTVVDENGIEESITTTAEHPFYVDNFGWLEAGDISLGTVISGPKNENNISIVGIEVNQAAQYAYNFTVDTDHTYFVGKTNMWVHNSCGKRKFMQPVEGADGDHTVFKTNNKGEITNHQTFEVNTNPNNPNKFVKGNRTDVQGKGEFNKVTGEVVETPHTHDASAPGGIRPAKPEEIPNR